MNYKRKSRRRFFLLMRSRTPPISSEFWGGEGLNTPNPPSVRHWTQAWCWYLSTEEHGMTLQKTVTLSCYSCENLKSQNVPCSTEGSHCALVHSFHTNNLLFVSSWQVTLKRLQSKLSPVAAWSKGPATQNAVCRSGLRSLSAAECYILSRLF